MNKTILFTGIRPTGDLHLGHFFSLIEPIINNYKDFEVYVLIADLHALTELRKSSKIDIYQLNKDIDLNTKTIVETISLFVPTDNLVIFRQSDLKEYHYDLFFKLLMVSRNQLTYGNPVFQDAIRSEFYNTLQFMQLNDRVKGLIRELAQRRPEMTWEPIAGNLYNMLSTLLKTQNISNESIDKIVKVLNTKIGVMGLASYPVLMAADILLYDPQYVLVGKDQAPHLQITNEFVKILNETFDTRLNSVTPMITSSITLKGSDGSKMSKTSNNYITIYDLLNDDSNCLSWFMKMKTFTRQRDQSGDPNQCVMSQFYYFSDGTEILDDCRCGKVGCVDCKKYINNCVRNFIRKAAQGVCCTDVESILISGKKKAESRILSNEKILPLL